MDNSLAIKDNLSYLKTLKNYVTEDNSYISRESRRILKINYEDGLEIPKGSWVLGQKRENNKIVDPGKEIKYIIIQRVMYKYFFIIPEKNILCQSKYLKNPKEEAYGTYFKNNCKYCEYRKNSKNQCKFQAVIFCLAIVDKTKVEDAIIFIKGDSFMPLINFLKESCRQRIVEKGNESEINVPYFSYLTELSTKEKRNKSVNYYVASFKKVKYLTEDEIKEVLKKSVSIENEIQEMNKNIVSVFDKQDTEKLKEEIKNVNVFIQDDEDEISDLKLGTENLTDEEEDYIDNIPF